MWHNLSQNRFLCQNILCLKSRLNCPNFRQIVWKLIVRKQSFCCLIFILVWLPDTNALKLLPMLNWISVIHSPEGILMLCFQIIIFLRQKVPHTFLTYMGRPQGGKGHSPDVPGIQKSPPASKAKFYVTIKNSQEPTNFWNSWRQNLLIKNAFLALRNFLRTPVTTNILFWDYIRLRPVSKHRSDTLA